MKRTSFVVAVLAAAVAAAAVAAVSFAAGGSQSATGITLHLVEKDQAFHYVDNPPVSTPQEHFASQGDVFVFTANLFTQGGKRAGTLNAYCVVTQGGNPETSTCTGTFGLAGGQLAAMASMRGEGGTSKIAVVGGTGAYEGAKGSAVSISKPNGNTSRDTIHLILP
ncbi:MAG TPA: hypothetical protein VJT84_14475 [Gaiellaceae bacterium]|nr:hypothetical protein [Gaiellaceae bacterium]